MRGNRTICCANLIDAKPVKLLVIPGNHDLELDPVWWAKKLDEDDNPELPQKASALFAAQGIQLLEEGVHSITLKNGRSFRIYYASPYTPEFNGYAFAYGP